MLRKNYSGLDRNQLFFLCNTDRNQLEQNICKHYCINYWLYLPYSKKSKENDHFLEWNHIHWFTSVSYSLHAQTIHTNTQNTMTTKTEIIVKGGPLGGSESAVVAAPSDGVWLWSRSEPFLLWGGQRGDTHSCISRSWSHLDRGRKADPLGSLLLQLSPSHTLSPSPQASSPLPPYSRTAFPQSTSLLH